MASRGWKERSVRLSRATVTTFDGPGAEWTLIVHGKRSGAARVTRQKAQRTRTTKRGAK